MDNKLIVNKTVNNPYLPNVCCLFTIIIAVDICLIVSVFCTSFDWLFTKEC